MAKKLKDYYDLECAKLLAGKIHQYCPEFDQKGFVQTLEKTLPGKEFFARQDVFADAFENYLVNNYVENIKIFTDLLGPELTEAKGMFIHGWWLWPIGRYIERHGVKDFDLSMAFIYELTKRFTGEFAIRPLIAQRPKKALQIMLKWSKDDSVHVRRLASEGVRIRLPWAKKSLVALNEFELYKRILAQLKSAPEKFIQKSVGNNLNDLMKEQPEKAREIIDEWQKDSPTKETLWIIKHGLRNQKG